MAEGEENTPPPAMEPLTGTLRIDGVEAEVTLAPDGTMRWRGTERGGKERSLVMEREVLGFDEERDRGRIRIKALVESGSKGGGVGETNRVRKDFVLEMRTGDEAAAWAERIKQCIDALGRPKRLFVIVNPFGGKKRAQKIFNEEVRPLLVAAGVTFTMQETKNQLHAHDMAKKLNLLEHDGIVCVSGDGILVEVLNGLLQREDWRSAIKMPLGIIPAGTGNGMIKSLLDSVGEAFTVSNAVLTVIQGHKRVVDVATISQGGTLFFSILMLSWGLVADVDIESEKYRWMGSARFTLYPLLRIMKLRKYKGVISFVPAPGYETYGIQIDRNDNDQVPAREDDGVGQQQGYLGPKNCYNGSEWRNLEGPFVSVWLHNVPWASNDSKPAPHAKFSDGYYDLIVIKDCSKSELLAMLLKLEDGSHIKSPCVTYLKVKAFRLTPGQRVGNPLKEGIIDSDGEVLARGKGTYLCDSRKDLMSYGPIEMQVEQGLATIFSP